MRFIPVALFFLLLPGAGRAQDSAPAPAPEAAPAVAPCSGPRVRQLDFWVGNWEFDGGDGVTGVNRVTRDEFGSGAIVEHFNLPHGRPDGETYIGGSYSMYDHSIRRWRQMWVDNNGSTYHFVGGPVEGQPYIFEFTTTEPIGTGTKAYWRMIFEDVRADSYTWRWQEQAADGSWTDKWVVNYRRAASMN